MAKKKVDNRITDDRQSRKEVLLARKQAQQTRNIRIGVIIVASLLAVIVTVALVNELLLAPNRPVATIGDETITLREWQNRVEYERAQRIILLENQLEAFGGDVGILQQLAPQAITDMATANADQFGQTVLDLMVDEAIVAQAAAERGISVSDEEVQREIAATYNYFGGERPTPNPTATATIQPTPSLTPIASDVVTATATPLPTATVGPTLTPVPTPTLVPEAFYQEQYGELRTRFADLGVAEATYLEVIRNSLLRDRLTEALAVETEVAREGEQASVWVLSYETEAEANEALALIEQDGFLTVWNTIRSQAPGSVEGSTAVASEALWRTRAALESAFGAAFAEAAFGLPVGETSDIVSNLAADGTTRYYILQPSGREVRPLSATDIQNAEQLALTNFLDAQAASGIVNLTEAWRGRAPTTPILDPIFFSPPTAAPTEPALPTPQPLPTEAATPSADE